MRKRPAESEEVIEDHDRISWCSRLVDYNKRFRDAASIARRKLRRWQRCGYSRMANDLPTRRLDPVLSRSNRSKSGTLVKRVRSDLARARSAPQAMSSMTTRRSMLLATHPSAVCWRNRKSNWAACSKLGCTRARLVAMFLATLELARLMDLSTEQNDAGQPLYLLAGPDFKRELGCPQGIDNLSFERVMNSNMAVTPR